MRKFIKSPRIYDFVFGQLASSPWYVDVYIEKRSLSAIDLSRKNLEKWLEKAWYNKELMIENYVNQYESLDVAVGVMAKPKEETAKEKKKMKKWFSFKKTKKDDADVDI